MIRPLMLLSLTVATLAGCGDAPANKPAPANRTEAAPAPRPLGDTARVRLETELGAIVLELDHRHAPITTANFVRYVDEHRLDGITFYRAARTEGARGRGFIQGGVRREFRRVLPPIAHEPTSQTGLRHVAGAISMAQTEPGLATGEFFIITDAMPQMDAWRGNPGYAVFGRVTEGMDVVRRILAAETVPNVGRGAMRGQMIRQPVRIVRAVRVE